MNINLPAETHAFLQQLVQSGKFASPEEAVAEALSILEYREKLRAQVQVGIDELDRGEGIDADEVFDEIEAEIEAMIAKQEAGGSSAAS